jgi:hypothetical protein
MHQQLSLGSHFALFSRENLPTRLSLLGMQTLVGLNLVAEYLQLQGLTGGI